MKKKSLLFLTALAFAPAARAADARLQALKGRVTIKTGGAAPYDARQGDPLFYGDEIKTAPDALVHVVFKDGAALLVKGGSEVAVKGRRGDTFLHFNVGEFLIGLKKKLGPGERFRVRTPAAVAAVRGTLFWGLSDPTTRDTTYACFENHVDISAGGRTVSLDPGQKVNIPFGKAPDAVGSAADIPADYVNTFKVDGSLQGLEALMPAPAVPAPAAPAKEDVSPSTTTASPTPPAAVPQDK